MTQNNVTISIAFTESERADALAFIERFMRATFGCDPPPTTGVICIAKVQDEIVGSIVLAGTDGEEPFPLEVRYTSSRKSMLSRRGEIVQGSRWTSSRKDLPEVAPKLLYFAFYLARNFGKQYLLVEAKSYSIRHLRTFGVQSLPLKGVVLLEEKTREIVGDGGMRYFITPPKPKLYLIKLAPALIALNSMLAV